MKRLAVAVTALAPMLGFSMTGLQALSSQYKPDGEPTAALVGYMAGTIDSEISLIANTGVALRHMTADERLFTPFCPRGNASAAAGIVREYLRLNPSMAGEQLAGITRAALVTAWPCRDDEVVKAKLPKP